MQYLEFKQKYQLELNEQQENAVQAIDGATLLLAVPGSGKTTVLISRLGYMVLCKNILPETILTVIYTVAATNDMSRRFEEKSGNQYKNRLAIRTINGVSHKIFTNHGKF